MPRLQAHKKDKTHIILNQPLCASNLEQMKNKIKED
jgi:hypothetical protein